MDSLKEGLPRMGTRYNLTGQRFGRLLVLKEAGRNKDKSVLWLCRCDCGNEYSATTYLLRSGKSESCGCLNRERIVESCRTHGLSNTPLWNSWRNMVKRTTDPKDTNYSYYGGRGISVCSEWRQSFEAFVRDMGPTHGDGLTLDRIDVNGNYEPTNCRWATPLEQGRNKRNNRLLTFRGETMPLSAWAERVGVHHTVIRARLRNGWSVERALTAPAPKRRKREPITFNGETLSIPAWATRLGIDRATLAGRIDRGWPLERALTTSAGKTDLTLDSI